MSEFNHGNLTHRQAIDAVIRFRINSMLHQVRDRMLVDKEGNVRPAKQPYHVRAKKYGSKIEHEISVYQKSTHFLIPRAIFARVVKEIAQRCYMGEGNIQFTVEALAALQTAAEDEIIRILEISTACSHHAKRVTLRVDDMRLARFCRGRQPYEFVPLKP